MRKTLYAILVVVGMFFGAGFASGREIVLFFSQFGEISFLSICLASFSFFYLSFKLLTQKRSVNFNEKVFNFCMLFVEITFSSAMFAGIQHLICDLNIYISIAILVFVVLLSVLVLMLGVGMLQKISIILVPFMLVLFVVVLVCCGNIHIENIPLNLLGLFISPFYVTLNLSLSILVFEALGEGMTKKQALFVSLFSSIILFFLLMFSNAILLSHTDVFCKPMPFISLLRSNTVLSIVGFTVIFLGCLTSLLVLLFSVKTSLVSIGFDKFLSCILTILIPYLLSLFGFAFVVSFLYPICSILGVILLSVVFFFK